MPPPYSGDCLIKQPTRVASNYAVLLILSIALQVALFRFSSVLEYNSHASFWYAPAGLTVALFLLLGSRAFPIVFCCVAATTLLNDPILERGADPALSILQLILHPLAHTVPYWVGVYLLQRTINGRFNPRNPAHSLRFLTMIPFPAAGSALLGGLVLQLLAGASFAEVQDMFGARWIGDMVAAVCLSIAIAYLLLMALKLTGADLDYRFVDADEVHQKRLPLHDLLYLPLALLLFSASASLSYAYPEKLGFSFPVYAMVIALLWTLYKARSPVVYLVLALLTFALAYTAAAFGLLASAAEYQIAMIAVGSVTALTNAAVSSQREALTQLEWANKRLLVEMREKEFRQARIEKLQRKQIEDARQAEAALRESHQELERRAEKLGRLASELTLTEQRERERLAKILHDHLQQLLVGATFGLARLSRHLGAATTETENGAKPALDSVKATIDEAITVSRTLVTDLSPPILQQDSGLNDALQWLARNMRDRHGLTVALNLDADASPARDDVRSLLYESVREALLNIVKHAQCGHAEVTLAPHQQDQARILVEDRGAGFDVARLTLAESDGTGFGILSVRERLRFLGGQCRIDSEPGVGTRVTLIAPLGAQREPIPLPTSLQPPTAPAEPAVIAASTPSLRILLVDDHAIVLDGLAAMLDEEPDLDIVGKASDGIEALEQVERLRPDLVLMDASMPRMDGLEATRRIKRRWPQVRVIGLSMDPEADRAAAMLNAGASVYVDKTASVDVLLAAIRGNAVTKSGGDRSTK